MKDLPTRNVPDTIAEGLAALAREHGMSAEAFRRKLFTDVVAEHAYRELAADPEWREYENARRAGRAARAERADRDEVTR